MTTDGTFTDRTLAIAEYVSECLASMEIDCAVIGGAALSIHGYTRATEDFDLGIILAAPDRKFPRIKEKLSDKFTVDCVLPDSDDPLGGAMTVEGENSAPVEILNLLNIHNAASRHSPASDAISEAQSGLIADSKLRVVTLPYLVAIKLYAGGLQDLGDVSRLLEYNPQADLEEIRALCVEYDLESRLEKVLDDLDR